MQISILKSDRQLPTPRRAHPGDAGLDLYASAKTVIESGERAVVGTGVAVAVPEGYAGLVVPRSGLAARYGIGVVNSPGVIDSGYRGEVKVILVNHGRDRYAVARGDRIAQLVVLAVATTLEVIEVEELGEAERGNGGFGSTGR